MARRVWHFGMETSKGAIMTPPILKQPSNRFWNQLAQIKPGVTPAEGYKILRALHQPKPVEDKVDFSEEIKRIDALIQKVNAMQGEGTNNTVSSSLKDAGFGQDGRL